MSRADVAARRLTERFGVGDFPIDLDRIARELGVIVVEQHCAAAVSGMLLHGKEHVVIGLNTARPPASRRFALAHLLGHLQLHRVRPVLLDTPDRHRLGEYGGLPTDREEAEANRFAGALLMPEGMVRRAAAKASFGTGARLVEAFAERFGLSPAVVSYRLMSLGILLDIESDAFLA